MAEVVGLAALQLLDSAVGAAIAASWTPADASASLAAMACDVKARALGVDDLLETLHQELGEGDS